MRQKKSKLIRNTLTDNVFYTFNYIFMLLFFILVAYPIVYVFSASFSDPNAVTTGKMWLFPVDFTLDGYKVTFNYKSIQTGYINSIIYTVLGTLFSLILTVLAAFPLSRRELYGKSVLTWAFFITGFFGGGLIPTYLVIKGLHMTNTIWAVTLVGSFSMYNAIVMKSFFATTIPDELLEAAKIDGCGYWRMLLQIVLPLSKAIVAIIGLFSAVSIWNSYFNAMIYLNDAKKFPLQLVLRDILILNTMDASALKDIEQVRQQTRLFDILRYSSIVVSIVPLLILYPFVQKYFVKGVMVGSVKG